MKINSGVFWFLLVFFYCDIRAQLLPMKIYYTEDGLASSQVWSIAEDVHGYIWFGCSSGISKFNGFKFINFRLRDGLPSESIIKLVSSKSGIVVALTVKGLAYTTDWGNRFFEIKGIGEYSDIAIREGIDGKNIPLLKPVLYAAMVNGGIYAYSFKSGLWRYFGFKKLRPVSLGFIGDKMFFSTIYGEIYSVALNEKTLLKIGKVNRVKRIKRYGKNGGIFISEKRIYLFKNNKIKTIAKAENREEIFFDAVIDRRGNLWVASNFGLRKISKGKTSLYTSKNGVPGIRVLSVFESSDGILWFGTNHGACKLISENILVFHNPEKRSVPSYICFYYQKEKKTMMIGNTSGVILIKGNRVRTLNSSYISRFPVWAITRDNDGNFYFATEGGGVVKRSKDGKEKHFTFENGCLPGNNVTDLLFKGGTLYVSCKEGFAVYHNNKWEIYNLLNKLPVSYVRCLEDYKEGKILLGTLGKGILIFDKGSFYSLIKTERKEVKSVYSIYYNRKKDTIWAATNYGLVKVKNGVFRIYDTKSGFLPFGLSVVFPVKNYLWVGSDGGAQLFDPGKERVINILTRDDGLPGNEFTTHNAIAKDDDNNIWFGFFGGAAKIRNLGLDSISVTDFSPDIFLTSLQYFFKGKMHRVKLTSKDNVLLPFGAKEVFINFDVVWFRNEYSLNIDYKLQGINTNWNRIKDFKDMKIYFTSIKPGVHPLYLKISSILSKRMLTEEVLKIIVPKPWWQKSSYQALISFSALFLILGFSEFYFRYRNKRLIKERERLNKLVQDRTKQLAELNIELEEKNRILKQLANTDYLTGLFNRRYFMEQLNIVKDIAVRAGKFVLCFILFDIDNFKCINDTYGHAVGDEVLKSVAMVIQKNLRRKSDMVARYGGEEFIVALLKSDINIGRIIGENIRKDVENTVIHFNSSKIKITVSGGIHCVDVSQNGNNIQLAIEKADEKLYLAKRKGKNRIEG